jgi:hypothetical protein
MFIELAVGFRSMLQHHKQRRCGNVSASLTRHDINAYSIAMLTVT